MTIELFCNLVWDLSYSQVSQSIVKTEYKEFIIPKKKGIRKINYLPHTSKLFNIQKGLMRYWGRQELPNCVKGFRKNENYLSYLESHVGSKYFLRVDIKDFFPSITESIIKKEIEHFIVFDSPKDKEKILDIVCDAVTHNGVIPQGAPSSPIISNLIMIRIDQRITKYCQALGIRYTRYADDMLFSSGDFDFNIKKWFIKKIKYILSSNELKLNYSKIKVGEGEISLNGYVVSDKGIRLSRERLSDIRMMVSYSKNNFAIAKINPNLFLSNVNALPLKHRNLSEHPFKTIYQYLQFLCGYRSYLISFLGFDIDPIFAKKVKKIVKNIEEQIKKY